MSGQRERYDTSIPLPAVGFQVLDRIKLTLLYLRAAILIPIGIAKFFYSAFLYILSLYRTLFWLALITIVWYLLVIWWPYVMLLFLKLIIPLTNMLILLFNLFAMVLIIILRIVIMIWNFFVPFIGIFITIVFNIIFTIITAIFDAIGSINFEPIISAFINIIMILVDIVMKIIGVLIKVGTPILIQLSKIIATLVEVVMTAVKIILPIIVWIINSLFRLLEPILQIVSWYFGGISKIFGMSSMAAGRSLLSTDGAGPSYNVHTRLKFTEDTDGARNGDRPSDQTLTEYSNQMAYTMYNSAKRYTQDDLDMANSLMREVLNEDTRQQSMAIRSILKEFHETQGKHVEVPFEHTLSAVKLRGSQHQPKERKVVFDASVDRSYYANTGRHVLETDYEKATKNNGLAQQKIDEARNHELHEAAQKERDFERMLFATVVYNSASKAMRENVEEMISPADLINHWDDGLRYFGYQSAKEIRDDYINTYGNGAGFVDSLSWIGNSSFIKELFGDDGSHEAQDDLPFNARFMDWEAAQREAYGATSPNCFSDPNHPMCSAKTAWISPSKIDSARKLMDFTQQNQDIDITPGSKHSKESFGAFPMISTRNCFSKPKNKLCIKEIPSNARVHINQIRLTKWQRESLTTYVIYCKPWCTTFALIDLCRLWNAFVEIRFFISAIPYFNRNIATLTNLAPWTGVLLDWIFVVPKYENASLFMWVCWVNHLFDLWIWYVALRIAMLLWRFLWPQLVSFWNIITSIRLVESVEAPFWRRRKARMERIFEKAIDRGEITAIVDEEPNPVSSHIGDVIHEQTNIGGSVSVHHHHHYHGPSSSSIYDYDPHIRREAFEREQMEIFESIRAYAEEHGLTEDQVYIHMVQQFEAMFGRLNVDDIDHKSIPHATKLIENHSSQVVLRRRRTNHPQQPSSSSSSY